MQETGLFPTVRQTSDAHSDVCRAAACLHADLLPDTKEDSIRVNVPLFKQKKKKKNQHSIPEFHTFDSGMQFLSGYSDN